MVNASDPPITTISGRALVAMITVAKNVLSGSSRTNIRAMMPKNAPTVMSSLKLLAHCHSERETNAHQFDVLLDRPLLTAELVRSVERLDLVGEGRVIDERANAERHVGQRVRRELRERLVPARRDKPPHARTGYGVHREESQHGRRVLISNLAEALVGGVERDAFFAESA